MWWIPNAIETNLQNKPPVFKPVMIVYWSIVKDCKGLGKENYLFSHFLGVGQRCKEGVQWNSPFGWLILGWQSNRHPWGADRHGEPRLLVYPYVCRHSVWVMSVIVPARQRNLAELPATQHDNNGGPTIIQKASRVVLPLQQIWQGKQIRTCAIACGVAIHCDWQAINRNKSMIWNKACLHYEHLMTSGTAKCAAWRPKVGA